MAEHLVGLLLGAEKDWPVTFERLMEPRSARMVRWVGDDARFARRPGRTSPPYPDLEYADGAPFDGPEWPVIWQAP